MSNIPGDRLYANSHEWIRNNNDGTVTVGISDHAQAQLGDLVYVEVPEVGQAITAGGACAVVESVKAASDVYCPIGGEVVAVNEALADTPELINQSPYEDGWLFQLKTADSLDELLTAEAYGAVVAAEES